MRAYAIKKDRKYLGVFGNFGSLIDAALCRTKKEAKSKYSEKVVPVDIKEIK